MSAHYFKDNGLVRVIHLSDIYRFEGITFEYHHYLGPILCRKDGDPAARQPGRRSPFWEMLERWEKLSHDDKEKTRIYG